MKHILLIIIAMALFFSCDDNDSSPFALDTDIQLRESQQVEVDLSGTDVMNVNATELTDYRCPLKMLCINAGGYTADLGLTLGNENAEVELCNGFCDGNFLELDTAIFTLNQVEYGVILKDMNPYPEVEDNPNKQATIRFFRTGL